MNRYYFTIPSANIWEVVYADSFEHAMQKAADWQLEQVLEFIAADPMLGEHVKDYIRKAMRPQQQEDN